MARAAEQESVEIELKLAVSPHDVPRLLRRLQRFGAGDSKRVDNIYYDTADRLLARHKMALRVRHIGRRWVQTLKTEAGASALAERGEWETAAPRGKLDLRRFAGTPLAALLQAHPRAALQPAFRTSFSRSVWQVQGGSVEIAFDQGDIVAGERTSPILELELELKVGSSDALYRLALELAGKGRSTLALMPAVESKAARGYRLAAGRMPTPAKANARALIGALEAQTTLGDALRSLVGRATNSLLANAAGNLQAANPEFVHQARVAVRRMRSAARLVGNAAGWPAAFDDELRWLGRELGAVRDWDVLLAQTLPGLIAALPSHAQSRSWIERASRHRARDEQALREALASPRFARLALRLLQWSDSQAGPSGSLADVAARKLARLRRRLVDAAAFFAVLPASKQHRVRIHAKRLRYALDLFAVALPQQTSARYGRKLAHLQDQLGALNDIEVASARMRQLGRAKVAELPASDWFARQRQQFALQAEAALADLVRSSVPWH